MRMSGKPKDARPLLERGVSHRQAALEVTPRHPRYLDDLRGDYLELAETLQDLGEHADLIKVAEQLIRIFSDGPEEYLCAGAYFTISAHLAEKDTRLVETARKAAADLMSSEYGICCKTPIVMGRTDRRCRDLRRRAL